MGKMNVDGNLELLSMETSNLSEQMFVKQVVLNALQFQTKEGRLEFLLSKHHNNRKVVSREYDMLIDEVQKLDSDTDIIDKLATFYNARSSGYNDYVKINTDNESDQNDNFQSTDTSKQTKNKSYSYAKRILLILGISLGIYLIGVSFRGFSDPKESVTIHNEGLDFEFSNFKFGEVRKESILGPFYTMSLVMDVRITNNKADTHTLSSLHNVFSIYKDGVGFDISWDLVISGYYGIRCDDDFLDSDESIRCTGYVDFSYNEGFTDYGIYEIRVFGDSFLVDINENGAELVIETSD